MTQTLNTSQYDAIGGEKGVLKLVDRFYDLMDSDEETVGIRAMHAKSLRVSRKKLFLFLSGWLGGPSLYIEKYGHPRLRQRHLPFKITSSERDQWLSCINQALEEQVTDALLLHTLKSSFFNVANHMRNAPDEPLNINYSNKG
ncbi:MAG: group II truncated hemoglobin [Cocleimonas sp.]|nr:group II truncated hemoglobin [Cocleimonas sp.]